jgi:16S rRNA (cytosine967-C5)-methyltransferase
LERQRGTTSLPEAHADLEAYLVVTESHPRWLVDRWLRHYGPEQALAMCHANNQRPSLVVRANRLQTTPGRLLTSLRAEGCEAEPCRFAPEGILVRSHPPLDRLQGYRDGWFTIQDEAAILCGYLIAARNGDRVLDACAAPGGKATHVAELMEDSGEVLCLDHSRERLKLVEENARRLGLKSLHCLVGDAAQIGFDRLFDRIVVDAPCTGLGVLRRHPDAKWRKGPELIESMTRQQTAILRHLKRFVKPGGILVYITCSPEAEEDQHIIQTFSERHPDFALESVVGNLPATARVFAQGEGWFQTWPGPEGLDGFFGARLRRIV